MTAPVALSLLRGLETETKRRDGVMRLVEELLVFQAPVKPPVKLVPLGFVSSAVMFMSCGVALNGPERHPCVIALPPATPPS